MKNLTTYRSQKGWIPKLELLKEHISIPGNVGYAWKELRDGNPFIQVGNNIMLVCEKQEKLLPASVVNRDLAVRCENLEKLQGYKVGKKQKRDLKEQVIAELYAKAFVTSKLINVWINTENDLLCIETTSGTIADDVYILICKHLGHNGRPLLFAKPIDWLMRQLILSDDSSVDNFSLGRSCVLQDPDSDSRRITYKNESLDTGIVSDYVLRGKRPVKLEIVLGVDECSFTIDKNSVISKIMMPDIVEDRSEFDTDDDYFDNELTIRSGQCLRIINELIQTLGEQKLLQNDDGEVAA